MLKYSNFSYKSALAVNNEKAGLTKKGGKPNDKKRESEMFPDELLWLMDAITGPVPNLEECAKNLRASMNGKRRRSSKSYSKDDVRHCMDKLTTMLASAPGLPVGMEQIKEAVDMFKMHYG